MILTNLSATYKLTHTHTGIYKVNERTSGSAPWLTLAANTAGYRLHKHLISIVRWVSWWAWSLTGCLSGVCTFVCTGLDVFALSTASVCGFASLPYWCCVPPFLPSVRQLGLPKGSFPVCIMSLLIIYLVWLHTLTHTHTNGSASARAEPPTQRPPPWERDPHSYLIS